MELGEGSPVVEILFHLRIRITFRSSRSRHAKLELIPRRQFHSQTAAANDDVVKRDMLRKRGHRRRRIKNTHDIFEISFSIDKKEFVDRSVILLRTNRMDRD